jgi:hypothetical protein
VNGREAAAVVRALEALHDGEGKMAVRLLEDLVGPTPEPRHVCSDCGNSFCWPGQLADHRFRVHGVTP